MGATVRRTYTKGVPGEGANRHYWSCIGIVGTIEIIVVILTLPGPR